MVLKARERLSRAQQDILERLAGGGVLSWARSLGNDPPHVWFSDASGDDAYTPVSLNSFNGLERRGLVRPQAGIGRVIGYTISDEGRRVLAANQAFDAEPVPA